jgi:phosphoribosyl 1,2-cyclic phosphodiesterase
LVNNFLPALPVHIGHLTISAFPKLHDAVDPHSFLISCRGINVGVFTDIGAHCGNLIEHFSQCHACFLETNYDEQMLENGRYPYHLKKRIRGGQGHLSNRQALELFMKHKPEFMSHLFLSHLSRDNNDPMLAYDLFTSEVHNVRIIVASRYEPTQVYQIGRQFAADLFPAEFRTAVQASLF